MTTVDALDYSNARPDLDALVAAGIRAVGRYLSPSTRNNPGKHLTASELHDLRERGIRVFLLWETTADAARGGHDAGVRDAKAAQAAAAALDLSTSAIVYYAVDWDASGDDIRKRVAPYFGGIGETSPHTRIGVYGGYDVVAYLMDHGYVELGFQTYAWSGGRWYPGAQLRQIHNGAHIGGAEVDQDEIMAEHFGATDDTGGNTSMADLTPQAIFQTDGTVTNPPSRPDSPLHTPPPPADKANPYITADHALCYILETVLQNNAALRAQNAALVQELDTIKTALADGFAKVLAAVQEPATAEADAIVAALGAKLSA